ncbi:MAG: carboxymuconolactone decarboxylase family protein, partial [bacterium]
MQGDGWRESDLFSEREKAAIGWAEAVTNNTAKTDEAAFQAMRKNFSDQDLVILTLFSGMWNCSNRIAEALHLAVEPPGGRIAF